MTHESRDPEALSKGTGNLDSLENRYEVLKA